MPRESADPTAIAIGLLIFGGGGGAILLNLLFGAWVAFGIIATAAISLSIGMEVHYRLFTRRRHEQRCRERRVWPCSALSPQPKKTLHANPGKHAEVLVFELDSSLGFFTRHLS